MSASPGLKIAATDAVADVLPVRSPRTCTGTWAEAHELARSEAEPVFVPVVPFADDRGWSLMNLMAGAMTGEGQINFSLQHPGVVKAWHRHARQTDFWCCVTGHLKTGVFRESDRSAWLLVIGERRPGVLVIPPGLWHGAASVGADPAGLLYYVTRAYDPDNPDEERRAHDSVRGFPWSVRHG
jgi:dTDP-4-dehydrorhamnose 3,5-epimerase